MCFGIDIFPSRKREYYYREEIIPARRRTYVDPPEQRVSYRYSSSPSPRSHNVASFLAPRRPSAVVYKEEVRETRR